MYFIVRGQKWEESHACCLEVLGGLAGSPRKCLRCHKADVSGNRLVKCQIGKVPPLFAYFLLLLLHHHSLDWKRGAEKKRKCRGEESAELALWRMGVAEAGTSLGRRTALGMPPQAAGGLGPTQFGGWNCFK